MKQSINGQTTILSNLELRKNLIIESKIELEDENSDIDVARIKSLYKEANLLIPDLQKSFEDTISFHNLMLQNKMAYITKEIPDIEVKLKSLNSELSNLLLKEKQLTQRLKKSGFVEDLQIIISKLNEKFELKGKLEEQKRLLELSEDKLGEIQNELAEINKGINSKDTQIKERITEFNKYFSHRSNELYGEQFVLSSEKDEKGYSLNISSVSGNLGTGKKKGQMAAFDLAYIEFADAQGIKCLHFVLQDQIENVHSNQINKLLTEIVDEVNCQYILPVLRDKLPSDIDIKQYEVVSLSQSDKLFCQ